MATYPIDQGGLGAAVRAVADAGIEFTKMQDGGLRGFTDYPEEVFELEITHYWLPATDRDAILAFYDANKTASNSVVSDEGTFDAFFRTRPQVTEKSGPLYMVVSRMVGTKV